MSLRLHVVGADATADALRAAGVDVVAGEVGEVTLVAGGADAVRAAAEAGARRIVLVAAAVDRRLATEALDAGASGVLPVATSPAALVRAVEAVVDGFLVLAESARTSVRHVVLTPRQQEIVRLLVIGLGNAEIASRLYLTESTVKTHLRAVFDVLEVRSRKEVVDLVLAPGSPLAVGVLGLSRAAPPPADGYRPPGVS